jgi:hypothetical protein
VAPRIRRDVEHRRIGDDFLAWDEAADDLSNAGLRDGELYRQANRDQHQQCDHERLELAEPVLLQRKYQQRVQRRQNHADGQRQPEQQLQRDGGPEHLRQIAGDDRKLAYAPQKQACGR